MFLFYICSYAKFSLFFSSKLVLYLGKKINRESVSYSLQGSSSSGAFRAFNALGAIAFSFGDAMLPEIQVFVTFFCLFICLTFLIATHEFVNTIDLLLPEYCERTCKEKYVQRCISSIYSHYVELLAISLLGILGFWIPSPTLHIGFSNHSRMDYCYGKSVCCGPDIRLLSGIISSASHFFLQFNWM